MVEGLVVGRERAQSDNFPKVNLWKTVQPGPLMNLTNWIENSRFNHIFSTIGRRSTSPRVRPCAAM